MKQSDKLNIEAKLQIRRTLAEVFNAIIDPEKMSRYFISRSTGRMEEGKILKCTFPGFDMEFLVNVGKIIENAFISYSWDIGDKRLPVGMKLEAVDDHSTIITITEVPMNNDVEGIQWLKQNTEGWANFLCCLKAWLEYGIDLRKGAFDFLKKQS